MKSLIENIYTFPHFYTDKRVKYRHIFSGHTHIHSHKEMYNSCYTDCFYKRFSLPVRCERPRTKPFLGGYWWWNTEWFKTYNSRPVSSQDLCRTKSLFLRGAGQATKEWGREGLYIISEEFCVSLIIDNQFHPITTQCPKKNH